MQLLTFGAPLWISTLLCLCLPLSAEQRQLTCKGTAADGSATLSGVRTYSPYNALGDGYVKFTGKVTAGGVTGRITYEGYTKNAPFRGVIISSKGTLSIGVLDNTGGQMIIYGGTPTLGPPQILGRFACRWQ
jgi:hypothetical protein